RVERLAAADRVCLGLVRVEALRLAGAGVQQQDGEELVAERRRHRAVERGEGSGRVARCREGRGDGMEVRQRVRRPCLAHGFASLGNRSGRRPCGRKRRMRMSKTLMTNSRSEATCTPGRPGTKAARKRVPSWKRTM